MNTTPQVQLHLPGYNSYILLLALNQFHGRCGSELFHRNPKSEQRPADREKQVLVSLLVVMDEPVVVLMLRSPCLCCGSI